MKVWHCVPCPAVVKNLIVSELTSYSYQHHDTSMDVTTFKKKKPHSLSGKKQNSHASTLTGTGTITLEDNLDNYGQCYFGILANLPKFYNLFLGCRYSLYLELFFRFENRGFSWQGHNLTLGRCRTARGMDLGACS